IYPENISIDVSPERLRRYFVKTNSSYQVNKTIRDMCLFARQNMVTDPPFSNLDLITCRNVMIYLGPLLQKKVLPIFHYALKPNGFLVLGASETIGGATELFALVDRHNKIYRKSPHYLRPALMTQRPNTHEFPLTGVERPQALIPEPKESDLQQDADRLILS